MAVGGDAAERLGEQLLPGREQALRARALQARLRMGARRRPGNLRLLRGRNEGMIAALAHGLPVSRSIPLKQSIFRQGLSLVTRRMGQCAVRSVKVTAYDVTLCDAPARAGCCSGFGSRQRCWLR